MSCTVVVGCQWGDEGKGKIVDLLSADFDYVARFQGGANAGHTVYVDGRRVILHLVPTGILRPGVRCVLGNGMVIDPRALREEIAGLEDAGIACRDRTFLSPQAHIVTPLHPLRERWTSQDRAIGTTRRGIGPAYEDRAARAGLRCEDLLSPSALAERLALQWERLTPWAAAAGTSIEAALGRSQEELRAELAELGQALAPLVCDVSDLLISADARGERILCEGAQGMLLDVDHGTYPFVTSSHTTSGGACSGLGIPPQRISRVIGIVKAYATRVGEGPFPTEFEGPLADSFRERAGEFGATTRRPRRCGWYDAVLARRSARLNGVDELVVTKLDVLSGLSRLQVAVEYDWGGGESDSHPGHAAPSRPAGIRAWISGRSLEGVRPKYVQHPGWQEPIDQARGLDGLPADARSYLELLEENSGVPITRVSIGAGREQTFAVRH
ncbi:MAG: adenylosuccinate synthase [Candidatus Eisenbacteria bacterium]|nr:adenylosuccinate synthase [Candidatus Eisenbacteria bacterium]